MKRYTTPFGQWLLFAALAWLTIPTALAQVQDGGPWGFFSIKNNTGQEANDLHITFKANSKVPVPVTIPGNAPHQHHGGVFKRVKMEIKPVGPNVRVRQHQWHFDDATRAVKSGECVAILINWAVDAKGDPVEAEIDFENSYWTKDGRRIAVPENPARPAGRKVPNKISPEDFAQRGVEYRQGRPVLPPSPSTNCD